MNAEIAAQEYAISQIAGDENEDEDEDRIQARKQSFSKS
jgi:hypothetical protein